jgi:uncharacterized protein YhbP (UPF0306 family)
MNEIDTSILKFIKKHHVLTLSTCNNGESWCCSCFYAFDDNKLVFTSDEKTQHYKNLIENKNVSGTIHLETNVVGKIRGIQFTGKAEVAEGENLSKAKITYLKRFPFAIFMNTTIWVLQLEFIKMTDNRLGFGKKLVWKRTE